jgi:hypothetical protein
MVEGSEDWSLVWANRESGPGAWMGNCSQLLVVIWRTVGPSLGPTAQRSWCTALLTNPHSPVRRFSDAGSYVPQNYWLFGLNPSSGILKTQYE